jgi:hypothetical protein
LLPSDYIDKNDGQCSTSFMALDVPPPRGPLFVFGDPFLRKFVTIYDRDGPQVGFAVANHGPESVANAGQVMGTLKTDGGSGGSAAPSTEQAPTRGSNGVSLHLDGDAGQNQGGSSSTGSSTNDVTPTSTTNSDSTSTWSYHPASQDSSTESVNSALSHAFGDDAPKTSYSWSNPSRSTSDDIFKTRSTSDDVFKTRSTSDDIFKPKASSSDDIFKPKYNSDDIFKPKSSSDDIFRPSTSISPSKSEDKAADMSWRDITNKFTHHEESSADKTLDDWFASKKDDSAFKVFKPDAPAPAPVARSDDYSSKYTNPYLKDLAMNQAHKEETAAEMMNEIFRPHQDYLQRSTSHTRLGVYMAKAVKHKNFVSISLHRNKKVVRAYKHHANHKHHHGKVLQ